MAIGYSWALPLLGVLLATLALDVMGLFRSKNHLPVEGRTVLVTGASQGMGKSAARMLSAKGANVIIIARDVKKLAAALEEIKAAAKFPEVQRFHFISADVSSAAENARLLKDATTWNNGYPPDIVWAIAGSSQPTFLLDSSLETMRSQMELNYWAAAYLARETIQTWLSPSSYPRSPSSEPLPRHIIVTSSLVTLANIAGYSPYVPAKSALRAFCDSVRQELQYYNGARRQPVSSRDPAHPPPPTDIVIHAVFPGTIDSPGLLQENLVKHDITKQLEAVDPIQSEDEVAAGAIKSLERGDFLVLTNWWGRLVAAGSWGLSPKSSWWLDIGLSWLASLIVPFVLWDMDKQVFDFGKKWGLKGKPKEVKA